MISLFFTDIINTIYIAGLFYSTAVFMPLIIGINSRKTTATAAVVGSVCAVAAGLLWEFFIIPHGFSFGWIPSNVIGLASSFVSILIVSAIENTTFFKNKIE